VLSEKAVDFSTAQREVSALLHKRIVIGHALSHDFAALMLPFERHRVRDTAHYPALQPHGRPRALRRLAAERLGLSIQAGQHSSVEDARAALALYQSLAVQWEADVRAARPAPGTKTAVVAAGTLAA
jgi:RNA exonuclease 4